MSLDIVARDTADEAAALAAMARREARRAGRSSLLCCATRGRLPSQAGSAATTHTVCAETRRRMKIGGAAQAELSAVFSGYFVDTITGQETATGNAVAIECAVEITGAPNPVVRLTFGGANGGTIADGVADYLSDAVYPWQFGLAEFAAGTEFWFRERRVVAVGERFARYGSLQSQPGESTRMSNGVGASQVLATGDLATPAGGAIISCCFAPTLIAGRASGGSDLAVLALGDSIINGSNAPYFGGASDGADGNGGWFTDALHNVGGRAVPHCLMAFNSTQAQQTMEAPSMAASLGRRRALFRYFTHAVENYATNDIGSGGQSGAATLARRRKLWAALRSGDSNIGHVSAVTTLPRTDSTDGWRTTGNQAPRVGFGPGEARDTVNAGLAASLASGEINAIFDLNALLGNGNVWIVPGGSRTVGDGAIVAGTRTLSSATAAFTSGDVGKSVSIAGAGPAGALLCGSIVSVTNATTVTCNFVNTSITASTGVTNAAVVIGAALTDDGTHPNMAANILARNALRLQLTGFAIP